jgi:hypothetical protein
MKKSELKQIIREVILQMQATKMLNEVSKNSLRHLSGTTMKEEVYGERTYQFRGGEELTIDENGEPKDGDKWTDLGCANSWKPDSAEKQQRDANKDKKWYTVNLNQAGTKEGVYCPEAKMWYMVDSSG